MDYSDEITNFSRSVNRCIILLTDLVNEVKYDE